MKFEELFLEESIDVLSAEKLDVLELPLSRQVFQLMLVGVFLAVLAAAGRVFYLSFWKSSFYQARAEANAGKEVKIPAGRGIIYDRFGKPLVENTPTFSVSVQVKDWLSGRLDQSVFWQLLGLSPEEIKKQLADLDLEKVSEVIVARDVAPEKIAQLKSLDLDGVAIVNDYRRQYLDGVVFAHVLGHTGFDFFNEREGKIGLEGYYDRFLKGKTGRDVFYRDARGEILDKKALSLPISGSNLETTLDAELQKYFYQRLKSAINYLGSKGSVGIALQPQTGEVLALVSLPSFDNNFSGNGGGRESQFNRGVSGVYNPGSTIKPLMALAALNEGIINPEKKIYSAGFIEIPNPYYPDQPSRFLDWKPNGWVNLRSALAKSSNIYFYGVGGGFPRDVEGQEALKGLGMENIGKYWRLFGLGKKTGIDLMAEQEGFLPDPQEKELRTGDIWRLGDTYNVSIGQGDLLVTPIQLITQIASLGNGGIVHKPFLVKKAVNDKGETIYENQPVILSEYRQLKDYIEEVKKGMEDVVQKPYGTAYLLSGLPFKAAGKTGSAQVENNTKTNAFFVGYAPADNPKIAILVLVENAREGSLNAVPVAKDVLNWYYWNRLVRP